jgi:hypothetical protein
VSESCYFSGARALHSSAEAPYLVGVIDVIDPKTSLGRYGGQSLETVRARYPEAETLSLDEAMRRCEEAVIKAPIRISEERFMDLLEVLPPCRWATRGNEETFYMPEPLTGTVVRWAARIGIDYFELVDRKHRTHDDVIGACKALLRTDAGSAPRPSTSPSTTAG